MLQSGSFFQNFLLVLPDSNRTVWQTLKGEVIAVFCGMRTTGMQKMTIGSLLCLCCYGFYEVNGAIWSV